ncbi:MAG: hypothetical protein HY367_04575 [Candidatus Aenigmarchaeota archaeon]|nr:hypothetical protein [Candidatus Aenigmarchaeota archaeon]
MAETISMEVKGNVTRDVLQRLYTEITQDYVAGLLRQNRMPTDDETLNNVTTSYESFPTKDLALKAFEVKGGIKFWGIASGSGSRLERMAVKYLILEHIEEELAKEGIKSRINIADLNTETIEYMQGRGIFKNQHNLSQLRRYAKRKGNAENCLIGVYAAFG